MDRGGWQATVHGVARVRHDLVAKPPPQGFPVGTSEKEPICQCRRPKRLGFNPWVGKIS